MKQLAAVLSVHVGTDLKQRWIGYCAQHGTTASAAVRATIQKLLTHAERNQSVADVAYEQPDTTRHRVEVRLTGSELAKIREHAEVLGTSPNQWIVNLIRANLSRQAQFGMVELRALGESNSQLAAIGRNMNQIARKLNTGASGGHIKAERIAALSSQIKTHHENEARNAHLPPSKLREVDVDRLADRP